MTEGSQLPWLQVEPRTWQWVSGDGLTLLRVRRVGMDHEKNYYVYRNGKILGCRRDVDEAKAMAERGESEMAPGRLVPDGPPPPKVADALELPEQIRMTPQQRAAQRARVPGRPQVTPKSSAAPKMLVAKPAADPPPASSYVDPEFQRVLDAKKNKTGNYARITDGATIVVQDKNPRKPGSAGHEHYERMRGGVTVAQYIARHKSERDRRTARQWLSNTVRDGFATLAERKK